MRNFVFKIRKKTQFLFSKIYSVFSKFTKADNFISLSISNINLKTLLIPLSLGDSYSN